MKPVIQEEMTGCGIASVATIVGVTYRPRRGQGKRGGSEENIIGGNG